MGKGHRHQKNIKSEKAKVKLKSKKDKLLPKGLNVTDTSFKVKKIVIREQLKQQDQSEILSRRKLNVKELLTRLHHYNSTVRQEAIKELKDILSQHSSEILSSQLSSLLQGVSALSLDREKDIRRDALKVLNLILSPISNEQLTPFMDILISYGSCAMTHIDPNIKEDSLLFLDVLSQNCSTLLARSSLKVLPNFLDMISSLRTESQPGRQLTTNLNSKNTSVRWRIKVLSRLSSILQSVVSEKKSQKSGNHDSEPISNTIYVDDSTFHIPLFRPNNLRVCSLDFDKSTNSMNVPQDTLGTEVLVKYTEVLVPLMFESWIEVRPKDNVSGYSDQAISSEASNLLRVIVDIFQLLIEYIEILDLETGLSTTSQWFKGKFQAAFQKNLLDKFPYCEVKTVQQPRRRQEDFVNMNMNAKCVEQNLGICQVFVWFSSVEAKGAEASLDENLCTSIAEYLNDTLENWSNADNAALPQLTKVLRTLFLKASKTWYKHGMNLGKTLQTLIKVYTQHSKKELQTQLFTVLSEIVLNHHLDELQSEEAFKNFIFSLPNLLLRHSIHENTIRMLNRVALQHKQWIQKVLNEKHEAIIENAKKIAIIGTENEKRSRLAICNLFYFLDEQVYY